MAAGNVAITRIAREGRDDANAQSVEQRLDLPEFARQVVFADDVDVVRRGEFGLLGADHVIEQSLGAELVAEVFRAREAGRIHRNDGLAEFFARAFADRFDVITDERGHAGLIHEDRGRIGLFDDLADRFEQTLFAAVNDVEFIHIGGVAGAVGLRAARSG